MTETCPLQKAELVGVGGGGGCVCGIKMENKYTCIFVGLVVPDLSPLFDGYNGIL